MLFSWSFDLLPDELRAFERDQQFGHTSLAVVLEHALGIVEC